MLFKCPGSRSFSQPHPELIKCAFCGRELEIWSDEAKAACPHCKKTVFKEGGASCLDWCKYAKECVGENIYNKYAKNKEKIGEKNAKRKDGKKPKRTA